MIPESGPWAALVLGLLGSTHCVGMCGGIAGALAAGAPPEARCTLVRLAPWLLAYNLGRIASYCVAGAMLGALGGGALAWLPAPTARGVGFVVSGVFLTLVGLHLAGVWRALDPIERRGLALWRRIAPLVGRVASLRTPLSALGVGLAWGWLPCGLVYAALILSLGAGSAAGGAQHMAMFGLGTLPALLLVGGAAQRLTASVGRPGVRRAAGACLVGLGLLTLAGAIP